MDKSLPLDLVLHFDYVPYDEQADEGWEPDDVRREVSDFVHRLIRTSSGLSLEAIDVLQTSIVPERPKDEESEGPTEAEIKAAEAAIAKVVRSGAMRWTYPEMAAAALTAARGVRHA